MRRARDLPGAVLGRLLGGLRRLQAAGAGLAPRLGRRGESWLSSAESGVARLVGGGGQWRTSPSGVRRRAHAAKPHRAGIWAVLIAAVAAAAVLGAGEGGQEQRGSVEATTSAVPPRVAPAEALSSSWYCAGATDQKGPAPATLVLANVGSKAVRGEVTVVSTKGPEKTQTVSVPPEATLQVPYSQLSSGSYAAATAVLYGGEVAAWQLLSGAAGPTSVPCSPATHTQWYEASGSTAGNNQIELALYNPLAAGAVADLSFATTHGPQQPGDFQGVVIPPRKLVMVDVGLHVQQQPAVATTVIARFGQLVVDQLSTSGTGQGATATLALGATGTTTAWYFPAGQSASGAGSYQILNPGASTARVRLQMNLASGKASPFSLAVPSSSAASFATSGQLRLPEGVAYSVSVRSGTGVVAARTEATSAGTLMSSLLGAPRAARSWVLLPVDAGSGSQLVLQNPRTAPTTASIASVGGGRTQPLAGLGRVALSGAQAKTIQLKSAGSGVVLVRSSHPLVAEWVTSAAGGRVLPSLGVVGPSGS